MTYKLSRIGVLSAAKLYAAIMALGALMVLIPTGIMMFFIELFSFGQMLVMLVFVIGVYSAFGFIFGALFAFIYNVVSSKVGGLEIKVSKEK